MAIGLEILEVRRVANVCWVVLAISDIFRQVYSLRQKSLAEEESKRLQGEIDRLNTTAAEANLARVKIEQRMSPRKIGDQEHHELIRLLSASAGQTVDIVVFDHHIQETKYFGGRIFGLFCGAKWKCRLWESRAAKYRIPGTSLLIVSGEGHVEEFKYLANTLAELLNRSGVDCAVSPDRFGCKGEFTPGDFHLDGEHPPQYMGLRIVAPFRIQIGAKQVVPPASVPTLLRTRPPTKEAE
jgi:hypothetical protein